LTPDKAAKSIRSKGRGQSMGVQYKVVLRGFSAFERSALASYFRLSASRSPGYEQVPGLDDADFAVADADQPAIVEELRRHGRLSTCVFVGSQVPPGAMAWTMRPIDPLHVMRELDAIAALHHRPPSAAPLQAAPTARNGNGHANGNAAAGPHPQRRASDTQPADFDDRPVVPEPSASEHARTAKALVVGGDEVAKDALEGQLRALGWQPRRASGDAQALELLSGETFDVVIVDVDPSASGEFDGLGLCQRIKREQRDPAGRSPVVILLAAHAAPLDRVRGTVAGCDAYLDRPLDDAELRRTLRRHGLPAAAPAPAGG
jgi:CheY-like chemotaxis protein